MFRFFAHGSGLFRRASAGVDYFTARAHCEQEGGQLANSKVFIRLARAHHFAQQ